MPGGANRVLFLDYLQNMEPPYELLIYGGGAWYNVNNIRLAEAVFLSRTGVPAMEWLAVLDNGSLAGMETAKLIDDIIRAYPLDSQAVVESLYQRYLKEPEEDKVSAASNYAIADLIAAYLLFKQ